MIRTLLTCRASCLVHLLLSQTCYHAQSRQPDSVTCHICLSHSLHLAQRSVASALCEGPCLSPQAAS